MKKPLKMKVQEFKFFNILGNYFNGATATAKLPSIFVILFVLLTIAIYGAVRLIGEMKTQVYLIFPVLFNNCFLISLLLLLTAAKQSKLMTIGYHDIRHPRKSLILPSRETRREIKSIKEFGIQMGTIGIVTHAYLAQFIMALANASLSVLVAYPNAK
jgi:hypothetical protein